MHAHWCMRMYSGLPKFGSQGLALAMRVHPVYLCACQAGDSAWQVYYCALSFLVCPGLVSGCAHPLKITTCKADMAMLGIPIARWVSQVRLPK